MKLAARRTSEGSYIIERENKEVMAFVPHGDFARAVANQIVLASTVDVDYIMELLTKNAALNEAHQNLLSAAQAMEASFDTCIFNIKTVDALKRAVADSKKALDA
jgi:hypothetical protein